MHLNNPIKQKKIFVIDTNVFLQDADSLFVFKDNDIVIPMIVLEEIDRKKDRFDAVGANARQICRSLDRLRHEGSLREGVKLPNNGLLRVLSSEEFVGVLPDELNDTTPDNMIIAVAVGLRDSNDDREVIVVTNDINMRIKCNVIGVQCEDYRHYRVATNTNEIYTGMKTVEFPVDVVEQLEFARSVQISDDLVPKSYPNEFLLNSSNTLIARREANDENTLWRVADDKKTAWGVSAKNIEQQLALKLLFDDRIQLVSLVGPAGTGKTLLAVAAALEQIIESETYKKLIITRPIQTVGKDIGFLPGTKEEKMNPWVQPIYDNIEYLMGNKNKDKVMFDAWIGRGLIEIEAIAYIRGRSIAKAFIIIDEAQNLSVHELKTIITRAGEGSKIILTGDIEQIDNVHVNSLSNGLTYAVEKFKDQSIAGHITLSKGERSKLATIAAKIL